ncbi:MAG: glycosyltransferase [Bacteroidetes bacterium]|nr:glycosyltransferase [Bacteroidota bacterium]
MPKVLIINNRFTIGGPTIHTALLAKYLADDFEVLLVGGLAADGEANGIYILEQYGIKPRIIKILGRSINPFKDFKAYLNIKKIIKEFQPDIVHTHAFKPGFFGRIAASNLKVPVIIHTFHGHLFQFYYSKFLSKVLIRIEKYLARKSNKIIAISALQKEDLIKRFNICNEAKIELIPIGIETEQFQENIIDKRKEFRKTFKIDDDEIAIGIVGRIVKVKNHELFLKAIDFVVKNSDKKIRAFIFGDGIERGKIKSLASDLNIDSSDWNNQNSKSTLTFVSWYKEIEMAFAGMDIIAQTSLNEGTPLSLMEAQASSKPIVSTDVGGIRDITISGKTALLSDGNDEKMFFDNLLIMVKDDNLRHEMSVNSLEYSNEKFHYSTMIESLKKLYNNLLSQADY